MREPSKTHVAVLKGGWSAEREVSLRSGTACAEALRRAGYRVSEIDAGRNLPEVLLKHAPDVAFNALHGHWGEDGCVQGILETLGIPYTHSGVLASALAMHKEKSKAVFRAARIPVAESLIVDVETAASRHPMPPPYVIKPVAEGSSVGVFIVHAGANGPPADLLAHRAVFGGEQAMVERFIPGRELTCAVMGDVALGVIDIVPAVGFYDYRAKYEKGGSNHILPAKIPAELYRNVQRFSLEAHMALGCRGVSRADWRYNDIGPEPELVLLEVNTQPGMTGTSLVPELAAHAGHSFEELVHWMIQDASTGR